MFTTRTALVSTATLALIGLAGSPAIASPAREASSSTREGTVAVAPAAPSSYAAPLEALGGLTLAQYLSDHMARRVHPGV
jgi:hypothetical protein